MSEYMNYLVQSWVLIMQSLDNFGVNNLGIRRWVIWLTRNKQQNDSYCMS